MLQRLKISNYALIDRLEMEPSKGFNIITGETGAGKSIMLGAVGLLVGNRADTKVLLDTEKKCIIEGVFRIGDYPLKYVFTENDLDYDDECIIRREINPAGKSRAFVNDTPVTLDVLKELGGYLIDVHSQHETILLASETFQTEVLDAFAGNGDLLKTYREAYRNYVKAKASLEEWEEKAKSSQKDLEFQQFQLQELLDAQLDEGELTQMEEELDILENAETVREKLTLAQAIITEGEPNVSTMLTEAMAELGSVSRIAANYRALQDRVNSSIIELKDIVSEIEAELYKIEVDPERAEDLRRRVDAINRLLMKHKVNDVALLIDLRNKLDDEVSGVLDLEGKLKKLRAELADAESVMQERAKSLTKSRKAVVPELENAIGGLLKDLGMPESAFKVQLDPAIPGNNGADQIVFLFSANKGIAPQELKRVASGGEFSRLMLSLKYVMASKTALPTLILDEIDTGVSGEIAIKMARMMQTMSQHHQLVAISHLPQIAAKGDTHYFVYKDNTSDKAVSKIRRLENEERKLEIAKMIGGDTPSDSAMKSAEELLHA